MRRFVFHICMMAVTFVSQSQANQALDSLSNQLNSLPLNSTEYVDVLLLMADELRQIDPDSSLITAQQAFSIIHHEKMEEKKAAVLHRIVTAYNFLGKFDTAVVIGFQAIDEGKKLEDKGALMKALNAQAINFYYMDDLQKAADYFERCYQVAIKENNELEAANALQNTGLVKGILGDVESEIDNYVKAREVMQRLEFGEGVANIDMNIGTAYVSLKRFEEGLRAFERARIVFEQLGHKAALCVIHTNLAETNLILGSLDKAEQNANTSIAIADELSLANEKKYTLEILSRVYQSRADFKNAFLTLKEYQLLKDSIFKEEKLNQIEELKVAYETQQQEDEIALLNTSNELKDARLKQQQFFLFILVGGSVLFLILVFILLNRYRMKKRSAEEKEVLLKEIHHRVKNNLQIIESLLSLQERTKGDKKPEELLKVSQDRIHAISAIHDKLYQSNSLKEINFRSYVVDLINHFSNTYSMDKIKFSTRIEAVDLDLDQLIPCGLIINELITNSLKYAFERIENPIIEIEGEQKENYYLLRITDNGNGFDEVENDKSIGLRLVKSLVNQLNGSIKKLATKGTSYQISFTPE